MECPECRGKGYVTEYGINFTDGWEEECSKCKGTGVIYSSSDRQPWDVDHPGWGRFTAHITAKSKWKTRFVVSGCECVSAVLEVLKNGHGIEFGYVMFDEEKLFPNQNTSYMIPCVYFFPKREREETAEVTKAELDELYWY